MRPCCFQEMSSEAPIIGSSGRFLFGVLELRDLALGRRHLTNGTGMHASASLRRRVSLVYDISTLTRNPSARNFPVKYLVNRVPRP